MLTLGGSRGDVQPYVALGLGLKAAGHEVRLAAPGTFEGLIRERGLDFHRISLDPQEAVRRQLSKGDANLLEFAWRSRSILGPILQENTQQFLEACRDAEAIIYTSIGFLGYGIARDLGLPRVGAMYGPLINSSRYFPSSFVPVPSGRLDAAAESLPRRLYNRLSYTASQQLIWQLLRAPVNRALAATPGLSPYPLDGPFGEVRRLREPALNGWSPHVLPQPPDWGSHLPVTGYWFLDRPEGWRPPGGLADFLDSGPPPVSVGFGSMSGAGAEELTEAVLRALKSTGSRGVLVTGWGGIANADLPDEVFKVSEVPHDWLFPRVTAAAHHGGAGTTAASLRAGVPTIVVPFFADQSFWGARVAGLGVGPRPIPRARLTAERLAAAIHQAGDAGMRRRARELGEKIRAEDGVARAVEAFHRFA
ncbi:MAG TPA: glycosyltransferase [Rubrobacteraceae bacterium]|nr:glycosyltransferase [Rubrobacteraceae bacterium]